MMLGVKDGQIIKVKGIEDFPHPLEYFGLLNANYEQIAKILENVAKDEEPILAATLIYLALLDRLNLSSSWMTIRFIAYELVRKQHPNALRERIYFYSIEQLWEVIEMFVRRKYE